MKILKAKEVLKILYDDGWYIHHQRGSHRQLKHPVKPGKVTVNADGNADIYGFLLKSIERQSGLTF